MKAITGNRLQDGAVVFLGADDRWTREISAAARFEDGEAASVLAAAQSRVKEVADAYLIEVDSEGALTGRETLRESIRGAGPTVRMDHGIQAGQI